MKTRSGYLLIINKSRVFFVLLIFSWALIVYSLNQIYSFLEPTLSISYSSYNKKEKNFLEKKSEFEPSLVKINFSFIFDSYQNHDNIFEIISDGDKRGIRMEFASNNDLALVVGGGKDLVGTIIKPIKLGKKYDIYIEHYKGKIKFKIDGEEIQINQYQKKLKLNKLTVGYGFSKERFISATSLRGCQK